jgi:DNA ligase (NAD+)
MPTSPTAEIARLREEICRHDYLYYVAAAPEISDRDYDRLMERLKQLEAAHPKLVTPDSPTQRIGDQPVKELPSATHRVPMLSIENTYNLEELKKYEQRVEKLLPGEPIEWVVELKVDGVAVSLIYEAGLLTHGITRGDGRTGDDITHNVRTIKGLPLKLLGKQVPPLLEVRGEIYMTNSDLVKLNEEQQKKGESPFANTRNVTAGSVRQLDPRICAGRRLRFFAHSVGMTEGLKAKTHVEFLEEIRGYGLQPTPMAECFSSFDAAVAHCEEVIERLHELDFEIDGLVLKVNRFDQRERLGATSKCPRWVIAYKFEKYEATTQLNEIRVQVGKTGTITPVADLEPVELAGTTVSRASLHNADEIERKDVRVGDTVVVEKAGKIIPHVVRVEKHLRQGSLRKFTFPTHCPECETKLVKDEGGVYIRCPNLNCPAQVKERIRYYASRNAMDIEELGEEIISALVDNGLVHNYGDLYRLKAEDLLNKLSYKAFGEKKSVAIIKSINESKERGLARLLYGLAIPQVGGIQALQLAEQYQTMDALLKADIESLSQVKEVGPLVAQIIHDCLHDNFLLESIRGLKRAGVVLSRLKTTEDDKLSKKKVPKIANEGYDREGLKKRLPHFVNKDSMQIEGLGEITLSTLIDENIVGGYADIYHLTSDRLSALKTPMRKKETQNLLSAIEMSKRRGLARLLNALSIRHVGTRIAAILSESFGSMDALEKAGMEEIEQALQSYRITKEKKKPSKISTKKKDIGVIARSIYRYLHSEHGNVIVRDLADLGVRMSSISPKKGGGCNFEGKTFVVTGTLHKYKRNEIEELINQHGGHATSSVSKNTDYLVVGENPGSKLGKAQELGVTVLSEEEFEKLLNV